MSTLLELQQTFASVLVSHQAQALLPHLAGSEADGRARLYAGTVYGTLHQALADIYPVLARLLGARCFDGLARNFIRNVPSRSGDLHDFGAEMPLFIAASPLAKDYPYLPHMARLEWAVHRVFHAADAPALELAQLQGVPGAEFSSLCFELAPASALLEAPYPVHQLWQANQPDQDGSCELERSDTYLLVLRQSTDIALLPLSPGEYAFLQALANEKTLAQAVASALEAAAGFDAQAALAQAFACGILVTFRSPS